MRKLLNIAALVALLFAAVPAKAQSSDKQGLADYLLEYHINALASGLPADVDVIRTLTDIWFDEDQVVFEFDLDADDVYERFRSGDVRQFVHLSQLDREAAADGEEILKHGFKAVPME